MTESPTRRPGAPSGLVGVLRRALRSLVGRSGAPRPSFVPVAGRGLRSAVPGGGSVAWMSLDGSPPGWPRRREAAEAEDALGRDLAALIRSEKTGREPDSPPLASPPAPPPAEAGSRRRLVRVLDGVGMAAALVVAVLGYRWLAALPAQPAASPWVPFGSGQDSQAPAVPAARPKAAAEDSANAGPQRPLGQFDFGPAYVPDTKIDQAGEAEEPERQQSNDVPRHRSFRELEAAFNAQYVPPPECNAWASREQMVGCGNHRMRALREFVRSGGQMGPGMRGELIAPSDERTDLPQGDWRQPDEQDIGGWSGTRGETWRQQEARDEADGWSDDPYWGRRPGWQRQPAIRADGGWGSADAPPQPAQTWRVAPRPPQPLTWQEEEAWREQQQSPRAGPDQGDWYRGQGRGQDWRSQYGADPGSDWPAQWREEWMRQR